MLTIYADCENCAHNYICKYKNTINGRMSDLERFYDNLERGIPDLISVNARCTEYVLRVVRPIGKF